jgi:hypothetical protein
MAIFDRIRIVTIASAMAHSTAESESQILEDAVSHSAANIDNKFSEIAKRKE